MNDHHASMREQGNVYSLPGPLAAGNKTSARREAKIRVFTPDVACPNGQTTKRTLTKYYNNNNDCRRDKSRQ